MSRSSPDLRRPGDLASTGEFGRSVYASTWIGMDPKEDLVALLFTQYPPKDYHFVDEFQTLVYQSLVKKIGDSVTAARVLTGPKAVQGGALCPGHVMPVRNNRAFPGRVVG